jgi:hypothetical protein
MQRNTDLLLVIISAITFELQAIFVIIIAASYNKFNFFIKSYEKKLIAIIYYYNRLDIHTIINMAKEIIWYRLTSDNKITSVKHNDKNKEPYYLINSLQTKNCNVNMFDQEIAKIKSVIVDILVNNNSANYIDVLADTSVLTFNNFLTIDQSRTKLFQKKIIGEDIRLSDLLVSLKENGLEIYLSGSTCLWSMLVNSNAFVPNDLDFYIPNIDTEKIYRFEQVLKQVCEPSGCKVIISNNALSINFIISNNRGDRINNIQLLKINFSVMSEIFAAFHLGHLCMAYAVHNDNYIYMSQRINDSHFFCFNSLIPDFKYIYAISKYVYRGVINSYDKSCSILKNPKFVDDIFDISYEDYASTFMRYTKCINYGDVVHILDNNNNISSIMNKFYTSTHNIPNFIFLDPKYFVCELINDVVDFQPTDIIKQFYTQAKSPVNYILKCTKCGTPLSNSTELETKLKKFTNDDDGTWDQQKCIFTIENHNFYTTYQYNGNQAYFYLCDNLTSDNDHERTYHCSINEIPNNTKSSRKWC